MSIAELAVRISADAAAFNKEVSSMGPTMQKVANVVATAALAISVAMTGAAVKGTLEFAKFQGGMNEVFTLMPGITEGAMNSMSGDVKKFAADFKVLPDEVIPALYQAISAGVPRDNVFTFLEVAQKAAVGGVTELSTAVDGISSVVNAYGSDVIDAAKASDLMFTAVKLGKTDFSQLSQSLFNVIPTAASLGVEFGDITAALAAMTAQGTPTSVATTQLRQVFVELSKAGSGASKIFQEVAGVTFKEFIAQGGNVQDALQLMEGKAADMNLGISDLFSSVEAGNAALALTGKGTETFAANLAEMASAAGATDAAYKQMDQGIGRAFAGIQASMSVMWIDLGEKLAPTVQAFADWISAHMPQIQAAVGQAFSAMGAAIAYLSENVLPVLVTAFAFIVEEIVPRAVTAFHFIKENFDVIGPALAAMALMVIVPALIAWGTAAKATAAAQIAALLPVLIPLAAVGLAVAALALIWKLWGDDIVRIVGMAVEWVTGTFDGFSEAMTQLWTAITETAVAAWTAISEFFISTWNALAQTAEAVWDRIETTVTVIAATITGLLLPTLVRMGVTATVEAAKVVAAWVSTGAAATVEAAKAAAAWVAMQAKAVAAGVAHAVQVAPQIVASWLSIGLAAAQQAAQSVAQMVVMGAKYAWLGVQSMIHGARIAASWIVAMGPIAWVTAAVLGLVALIVLNWDEIKEVTIRIFGAVWDWLKGLWTDITDGIGAAIDWLKDLFFRFHPLGIIIANWEPISTWFSNLWNGIKDATKRIWDSITGTITSAISAVMGPIRGLMDTISGAMSQVKAFFSAKSAAESAAASVPAMPANLPGFATGGMVPGPIGAPMAAIVHGGERVLTPAQQRGTGGAQGVNVTITGPIYGVLDFEAKVTQAVRDAIQGGGFRGVIPGV